MLDKYQQILYENFSKPSHAFAISQDKYQQILYENKFSFLISSKSFLININRYCTKTSNQDILYKIHKGDKYQQILYENANGVVVGQYDGKDKYQQILYENYAFVLGLNTFTCDKYQQILYENKISAEPSALNTR